MRPSRDNQSLKNFSSDQTFTLKEGGRFAAIYSASSWGTMTFEVLAGDGTTYVPVTAAAYSANGTDLLDLPSGAYKVVAGSLSGGYFDLKRVPIAE